MDGPITVIFIEHKTYMITGKYLPKDLKYLPNHIKSGRTLMGALCYQLALSFLGSLFHSRAFKETTVVQFFQLADQF